MNVNRNSRLAWLFSLAIIAFFSLAFACVPLAVAAEDYAEPDSSDSYEQDFPEGVGAAYTQLANPDKDATLSVYSRPKLTAEATAVPRKASDTSGLKQSGYAKYKWVNGDVYAGNWESGAMSGLGKYTYANGGVLSGTFKANKIVSGKYTLKTEKGTFKLFIKKGAAYKAAVNTKKGFKCKAVFKNGKFNGFGKATYPKGGVYAGYFKNGKRSGTGIYKWESGAKYKGKWKLDKMSGSGKYYYAKSSKAKLLKGAFAKNKPKGWCTYKLKSGKTYKTYWKKGKCTKVKL